MWIRWFGQCGVRASVDLVVLVVVGEAHWIGSVDLVGDGGGLRLCARGCECGGIVLHRGNGHFSI